MLNNIWRVTAFIVFVFGMMVIAGSLNIEITYDQTTDNGINDYYYSEDIDETNLFIGFSISVISVLLGLFIDLEKII